MHVCMCIYVYVYIHTHTHIHTHLYTHSYTYIQCILDPKWIHNEQILWLVSRYHLFFLCAEHIAWKNNTWLRSVPLCDQGLNANETTRLQQLKSLFANLLALRLPPIAWPLFCPQLSNNKMTLATIIIGNLFIKTW